MQLIMYPNCYVWPCKQIMNAFYSILTLNFKLQILYPCKLGSLSWWKSTQCVFSRERVKLTQYELFSNFFFKIVSLFRMNNISQKSKIWNLGAFYRDRFSFFNYALKYLIVRWLSELQFSGWWEIWGYSKTKDLKD